MNTTNAEPPAPLPDVCARLTRFWLYLNPARL